MKDFLIISDPEAVKALSDPLRQKILTILMREKEASATTIAERLNTSAPKISYHLKLLEKHGIIARSSTRVKGNLVEKMYAPSARRFEISLDRKVHGEVNQELLALVKQVSSELTSDLIRLAGNRKSRFKSLLSYDAHHLTLEEIKELETMVLDKLRQLEIRENTADEQLVDCKVGFFLLDVKDEDENNE